ALDDSSPQRGAEADEVGRGGCSDDAAIVRERGQPAALKTRMARVLFAGVDADAVGSRPYPLGQAINFVLDGHRGTTGENHRKENQGCNFIVVRRRVAVQLSDSASSMRPK